MLTIEQRKERSELAKKLGYGKWMKGRRLSAETRTKTLTRTIGGNKWESLQTVRRLHWVLI
jgi:hypothetical protein